MDLVGRALRAARPEEGAGAEVEVENEEGEVKKRKKEKTEKNNEKPSQCLFCHNLSICLVSQYLCFFKNKNVVYVRKI